MNIVSKVIADLRKLEQWIASEIPQHTTALTGVKQAADALLEHPDVAGTPGAPDAPAATASPAT